MAASACEDLVFEVETIAEEVDADEHVEPALAQGAFPSRIGWERAAEGRVRAALDGVNLAVQVADVDAEVAA